MSPYADLTAAGPLLAMEAAISARLRLAFPPREFEHAIVPARISPAGWTRLLRRTPFVGLGWGGLKLSPQSGRLITAEASWTVFLVNRNEAGHARRLLGDPQGVGQLGMAQVALLALHGLVVADVGTVLCADAQNLFAEGWDDQAGAMTGIGLGVQFQMIPLPGDAATGQGGADEFLRQVADWRIAPSDHAVTETIELRPE